MVFTNLVANNGKKDPLNKILSTAYLLGWQDIRNFVPPLLVFETAVNKQLFVNDSSFADV